MEIEFPLDSDGFLRRECPSCTQEFKWHHGPANEEAARYSDPDAIHCPRCGAVAGPDDWFTEDQISLIESAQQRLAVEQLGGMFKDLERKTRSNDFFQFKAQNTDLPSLSHPLTEPDDMLIVASPCHSWEPVKIPEDHGGAVYCLICGSSYAV